MTAISDQNLNANRAKAGKSKAAASLASLKDIRSGLCETSFIVENENIDEYYKIRNDYFVRFSARDQVELDLIDRMVHGSWNQHRAWTTRTK